MICKHILIYSLCWTIWIYYLNFENFVNEECNSVSTKKDVIGSLFILKSKRSNLVTHSSSSLPFCKVDFQWGRKGNWIIQTYLPALYLKFWKKKKIQEKKKQRRKIKTKINIINLYFPYETWLFASFISFCPLSPSKTFWIRNDSIIVSLVCGPQRLGPWLLDLWQPRRP